MKYDSVAELCALAKEKGCLISDIVIIEQAKAQEVTEEALVERMEKSFAVMEESVASGFEEGLVSASGLTGGAAYKMKQAVDEGKTICGKFFGEALAKALAVSETNACMGKIVAAPTAGSCGILPAALLTLMEEKQLPRQTMVRALFTASAVGMVIAKNASIAGAEGGCQAECGSASAMAAAALVEACGGTVDMVSHACAIAIKNILGLVCDPVAGLVEIPCTKRNAAGVANAFVAAELALAGIESAIPADEVIWAMKKVGDSMSAALKETAEGGLAATPTGKRLCRRVFGERTCNGGKEL